MFKGRVGQPTNRSNCQSDIHTSKAFAASKVCKAIQASHRGYRQRRVRTHVFNKSSHKLGMPMFR